jgi:hypothetical protein
MNGKTERNLVILVILIGSLVTTLYFAAYYNMIAKIEFTKDFGYNIETAEIASTFENLRASIIRVNDTIKTVFPGDQSKMYSTIFPWVKTPDHTLMMQTNMINLYVQRINVSIAYYNSYKQNATAALVNDWYTTTLQNVKTKWANDGGFDLLWSVYTIQEFGVAGNFALNIMPLFVIILLFAVIVFGLYTGCTDMKSTYTITYTSGSMTRTFETEAITSNGALKDFRERMDEHDKFVSIVKEPDNHRRKRSYY